MGYQISYDANIGEIPQTITTYSVDIITSDQAITGNRVFRFRGSGNTPYLQVPFVTFPTGPALSFWVYHARPDDDAHVRFYTTSGHYVSLEWDTGNYTWDIYVQGVKVADGTPQAIAGPGRYNLRFYGTLDNAGSLTVKLDGVEIATYSGDTLPDGSDANVEYIQIGFQVSDLYSQRDSAYVSSISLNDGGADPGDRRCYVCMPDGDSSVQWTPNTGTDNYAVLDDVPPSSDYVETETNGHVDKLTLQTVSDISQIHGVTKVLRAAKTTAATQQVKNGVDSNGTLSSTTEDLMTEQAYYFHCMENNPADNLAWEKADIDALLTYREAVIP